MNDQCATEPVPAESTEFIWEVLTPLFLLPMVIDKYYLNKPLKYL
jgi:hypothetical protein